MNKKEISKKIILIIVAILLVFAVIIILTYESTYDNKILINNDKILTLTNNSLTETISENNEVIINDSEPEDEEEGYEEPEDYEPPEEEEEEGYEEEDEYGDVNAEIITIEDNTIRGIIQVNILKYPENTDEILFMIYQEDSSNPVEDEDTLIDIIQKPFELEFAVDTNDFPNDGYILLIASTNEEAPDDDPWTSEYRTEVIIEN